MFIAFGIQHATRKRNMFICGPLYTIFRIVNLMNDAIFE
jgi:hypothetical protein